MSAVQLFMSYNPEIKTGCNITGTYSSVAKIRSNHYIPVTQIEVDNFKSKPNNYRIDDGKFSSITHSKEDVKLSMMAAGRQTAKQQILSPIEVDGRKYIPDPPFQMSLSLALHNTQHDPQHTAKFWCVVDDRWEFRSHNRAELLAVSLQLNARREEISSELYQVLTGPAEQTE